MRRTTRFASRSACLLGLRSRTLTSPLRMSSSVMMTRAYAGGHTPHYSPYLKDEDWKVDTDIEALFDPKSGYWDNPNNWDSADYAWKLQVDMLCDNLKIAEADRPAFRKNHDISKGYMTLEWVLPSPPPEHTFNELPIIKEFTTAPPEKPSFAYQFENLLDKIKKAKTVTEEDKQTIANLAKTFWIPPPVRPYLYELANCYAKNEIPEVDHHVHPEVPPENVLTEEEYKVYKHLVAPPEMIAPLGVVPPPGMKVPASHYGDEHGHDEHGHGHGHDEHGHGYGEHKEDRKSVV